MDFDRVPTPLERYIVRTPAFEEVLKKAICALTKTYIDPRLRQTFADIIEVLLRSEPNGEQMDYKKCFQLLSLHCKLSAGGRRLNRNDRLWLRDNLKTDQVAPPSDVELQQLDSKTRCFHGLVYRQEMHSELVKAIRCTSANKYWVEDRRKVLVVQGDDPIEGWSTQFRNAWEQSSLQGMFSADDVLGIISYTMKWQRAIEL